MDSLVGLVWLGAVLGLVAALLKSIIANRVDLTWHYVLGGLIGGIICGSCLAPMATSEVTRAHILLLELAGYFGADVVAALIGRRQPGGGG